MDTTVPLTSARDHLSDLIDQVERTHERVVITRHGQPVALLVSPDDIESLEENLYVLNSPDLMAQLAESQAAIAAGDILSLDDLDALMQQRRRGRGAA